MRYNSCNNFIEWISPWLNIRGKLLSQRIIHHPCYSGFLNKSSSLSSGVHSVNNIGYLQSEHINPKPEKFSSSCSKFSPFPLRGVFTLELIPKGMLIASIPSSLVFQPSFCAKFLSELYGHTVVDQISKLSSRAISRMREVVNFCESDARNLLLDIEKRDFSGKNQDSQEERNDISDKHVLQKECERWWSFDALLMSAVIHALRFQSIPRKWNLPDSKVSFIEKWMTYLPRSIPPIGEQLMYYRLIDEGIMEHTDYRPEFLHKHDLQYDCSKKRNVDYPTRNLSDSLQLPHADGEGEFVYNRVLRDMLFRNLTSKHRHQIQQKRFMYLSQLETVSHTNFLDIINSLQQWNSGIFKGFTQKEEQNSSEGYSEDLLFSWKWAHFMCRTRCINSVKSSDRGGSSCVSGMFPLVDMLNNSLIQPNCALIQSGDKDHPFWMLRATEAIPAGRELLVRYDDEIIKTNIIQRKESLLESLHVSSSQENDNHIKRIESFQRYDVLYDDISSESFSSVSKNRMIQSSNDERDVWLNPWKDAVWLWRYGFVRDLNECEWLIRKNQQKFLKKYIAELTDNRRSGKEKRYVIGVPEGFEHLQEQRKFLAERYSGRIIFPAQEI